MCEHGDTLLKDMQRFSSVFLFVRLSTMSNNETDEQFQASISTVTDAEPSEGKTQPILTHEG